MGSSNVEQCHFCRNATHLCVPFDRRLIKKRSYLCIVLVHPGLMQSNGQIVNINLPIPVPVQLPEQLFETDLDVMVCPRVEVIVQHLIMLAMSVFKGKIV